MQKIAYNQPLPPNNAVNSNEQKKETWFSKNAPLLCGVTVGVIALAVIWKLGQSKEQIWLPLKDSDRAEVQFSLVEHCQTKYAKEISDNLLGSSFTKFTTLFSYCVNNKMEETHEQCADRAANASVYATPEARGFQDAFPTLRFNEKGEFFVLRS